MKCKYSLTFEFEVEQPLTTTGIMEAKKLRTVAMRAINEGTKKHKGVKWSSFVLVLEKLDDTVEEANEVDEKEEEKDE